MKYWSENSAERFLGEVDLGVKTMFDHALSIGPGSPDEKTKKALSHAAYEDEKINVEMLKSDQDLAFGLVESSYHLIAPVRKRSQNNTSAYKPFGDVPEKPVSAIAQSEKPLVDKPASLKLVAKNDSEGETGMRRFSMAAYVGDTCDKNTALKLENTRLNPKDESIVTSQLYSLKPGARTQLQLDYADARFAQSRHCSSSVSFVPVADTVYQVEFVVDRSVTRCDARIVEVLSNGTLYKTAFEAPALVCGSDAVNGKPIWTAY